MDHDQTHGYGRHATIRTASEEIPADTTAPSLVAGKKAPSKCGYSASHDGRLPLLLLPVPVSVVSAARPDDDDGGRADLVNGIIIKDGDRSSYPSGKAQDHHQASATSPHPTRPARSFVDRMASAVKTFLACSLLTFASVHAAQRSHSRDTLVRQTASSPPVVTVKNGSIEGLYSPEYDQDFFLGMRYAQVCVFIFDRSLHSTPQFIQRCLMPETNISFS